MILIGMGSNLPSNSGSPLATCEAALVYLQGKGVTLTALSPWYETAPVPISDQPWFINGVAEVSTTLSPAALLNLLHEAEAAFGRARSVVNAPRELDLDLLVYGNLVQVEGAPLLPHPRLHERAFVLLPLQDIAPDWQHPVTGLNLSAMIGALPAGQEIRRLHRH